MKCPNCNGLINENATYCSFCGFNIRSFLADKNKTYEFAMKALNNNDYDLALDYFKKSAALKNDKAMYELANLYMMSNKKEKHYSVALYCYYNAAMLKNDKAIIKLFELYINDNQMFERDFSKHNHVQWGRELYQKLVSVLAFPIKQANFILINDVEKKINGNYVTKQIDSNKETELVYDDYLYEGESTYKVGFVEDEDGVFDEIEFEPFIPIEMEDDSIDLFNEELINLESFYTKMDELKEKYRSYILEEEEFLSYDEDNRLNELEKRHNNKTNKLKIEEIDKISQKPYGFRMTVLYEYDQEEVDVYVGKEDVLNKDNNVIVISWSSPLGNKVYDDVNSTWDIKHNIVSLKRKRLIDIVDKKLSYVQETFNYKKGDQYNILSSNLFLKEIIRKRHNDGIVHDIVYSIQHEQNQIIKSDFKKNLIMQGCAGCGKTMVLFHRIKYMLSNKIHKTNNICVVTPSDTFNLYIRPLISDLNLGNIKVLSIEQYYINLLNGF